MSPPPAVLVIGCGNVLRGDDGVGPEVVRRLAGLSLPRVCCVDAGMSGVDVVLAMRGRDEVVIVDACRSGAPAGTIRELDIGSTGGHALSTPAGLAIHAFRWDHAVALARSLLRDAFPLRVTAVLVEGARFEHGDGLSAATESAVGEVVARLVARFGAGTGVPRATVAARGCGGS